MNDDLSPGSLREIVYSFQKSRIILTAFELKIFTVLSGSRKSSEDTALAVQCDIRATDRLMNALVAIGLLKKEEKQFSNTVTAETYLVEGKPGYLGGLHHTSNMWQNWTTLTEAVQKGKSVTRTTNRSNDMKWSEAFIAAMHYRAKNQAAAIIEHIDLSHVKKLLDLGGGSGVYSMAFVTAKPEIKAVVFDLPHIVPITRDYIDNEGYTGSVEIMPGNYLFDDFGSGYDLIFMSAIVHINSYNENLQLIGRCARALNQGGQIIIQDQIMNDDRTLPAGGALFALNMLVGTDSGDTYTETEMKEWFKSAGISDIVRVDGAFESMQLIGRKRS